MIEDQVRNLSYHRILVKGKDVGTARICHRHTWSSYVRNNKDIPVAVCIGLDPALLFAAAISTKEPMDETAIAGGFYQKPVKMVRMENGICVPTSAEIVLLGRLTAEEGAEGPFVEYPRHIPISRTCFRLHAFTRKARKAPTSGGTGSSPPLPAYSLDLNQELVSRWFKPTQIVVYALAVNLDIPPFYSKRRELDD